MGPGPGRDEGRHAQTTLPPAMMGRSSIMGMRPSGVGARASGSPSVWPPVPPWCTSAFWSTFSPNADLARLLGPTGERGCPARSRRVLASLSGVLTFSPEFEWGLGRAWGGPTDSRRWLVEASAEAGRPFTQRTQTRRITSGGTSNRREKATEAPTSGRDARGEGSRPSSSTGSRWASTPRGPRRSARRSSRAALLLHIRATRAARRRCLPHAAHRPGLGPRPWVPPHRSTGPRLSHQGGRGQ